MEAKQEIIKNLKKAITSLAIPKENIQISLQEPKDETHGDYSTNVALIITKQLKKNPLEIANQIVKTLNTKYKIPNADRIEAVVPGFINFFLSKEYLMDQLTEVLEKKDKFGSSEKNKGKKIMVEFTDPNPFKEFHIGHLYSNVVGESLCRLLESQGALVRRVCYQGDVGLHIAKSLYAILRISNIKYQISNMETKTPKERAEFLGKSYAEGSKAYEESEQTKKEINELNKKIYEGTDPQIKELYSKGKQWSLDYFEQIYRRLGTKFEAYYFESEAGKVGLDLVKAHIADGIFEQSDGAVIFPGEKHGLHNRVFINSLGLPTYEAKDLGLPSTKYKDFLYDESLIVTANEINEYFRVVLKALSLISPDLAQKTKHIGHGVVRLKEGKMSSRTGQIITGEWLLDETKRRIQKAYKQIDPQTLEKVAVGAVKYALLKSNIGRDISFDFDQSISLEGNSGPYLQYTYARTQSVLAKVKAQSAKRKTATQNSKLNKKLESEELALLRAIYRFPEVVEEATRGLAPNIICNYVYDLAQKFNLFYQKHQILESDSREFRLLLVKSVGQILKNSLHLLGIKAPERM